MIKRFIEFVNERVETSSYRLHDLMSYFEKDIEEKIDMLPRFFETHLGNRHFHDGYLTTGRTTRTTTRTVSSPRRIPGLSRGIRRSSTGNTASICIPCFTTYMPMITSTISFRCS
jgi:hypothetical protein